MADLAAPPRKKRALCLCAGGNVRSATLVRMLRKRGYEGLNAGAKDNAPDTLRMLATWADIIFVADYKIFEWLQVKLEQLLGIASLEYKELMAKVNLGHMVGPDDWKLADHPDLIRIYRKQFGEDWY